MNIPYPIRRPWKHPLAGQDPFMEWTFGCGGGYEDDEFDHAGVQGVMDVVAGNPAFCTVATPAPAAPPFCTVAPPAAPGAF